MTSILGDAQPYDTYALILVSALIIWYKRNKMFTLQGVVQKVIPNKKSGRT